MLNVGDKAPKFALPDQNGDMRSLKDFLGKWVVLYFYPKDDTPGCTVEACNFRDRFDDFSKNDVKVIGISIDPVKKHAKFAEKYELPFMILSDESKEVVEAYEVWGKKKFMGREYMGIFRTTLLIDPKGKIAKIYENVKPQGHADMILADMHGL